jgi:hypothetical protein
MMSTLLSTCCDVTVFDLLAFRLSSLLDCIEVITHARFSLAPLMSAARSGASSARTIFSLSIAWSPLRSGALKVLAQWKRWNTKRSRAFLPHPGHALVISISVQSRSALSDTSQPWYGRKEIISCTVQTGMLYFTISEQSPMGSIKLLKFSIPHQSKTTTRWDKIE